MRKILKPGIITIAILSSTSVYAGNKYGEILDELSSAATSSVSTIADAAAKRGAREINGGARDVSISDAVIDKYTKVQDVIADDDSTVTLNTTVVTDANMGTMVLHQDLDVKGRIEADDSTISLNDVLIDGVDIQGLLSIDQVTEVTGDVDANSSTVAIGTTSLGRK